MAHRSRTSTARGFTLIEVMVALAILLIGTVGLLHLQIYGITANHGALMHMRASSLARELAAGLERLDYGNTLLATTGTAGATAPAGYGAQLFDASNATTWLDGSPIAGVTPDGALEQDERDTTKPLYRRRWTVWSYADGTSTAIVKLVAVSVVWHERGAGPDREVIYYTQKLDTANVLQNVQGYR